MKVYHISRKQLLPVSLEDAWSFFADASNLQKLTPPEMKMEPIEKAPIDIYPGMIAVYKVRPLFRVPITWVTEITQVQPMKYFVDKQRFGPFKFWHHEHWLEQTEEGVEVTDILYYAMPFSFLGKLIHAKMVRPKLQKLFAYRQKRLRKIFGAVH